MGPGAGGQIKTAWLPGDGGRSWRKAAIQEKLPGGAVTGGAGKNSVSGGHLGRACRWTAVALHPDERGCVREAPALAALGGEGG